jgi:hypothetical protein
LYIICTDIKVESYEANHENQNTDPLTFVPQPLQDPGRVHGFPSGLPTAGLLYIVGNDNFSLDALSGFPKVAINGHLAPY